MAKTATTWKPRQAPAEGASRRRVLTAAAQRIDLDSKVEAQRQRLLKQNWQLQAWSYFDSIPELGYAIEFIAHCVGRLRFYCAALANDGTSDMPIDLDEPALAVPPEVKEACTSALQALGNGQIELAGAFESLSINTSVAGESFLLGQQNPETGDWAWSIRSIEEIVVYNDNIMLREGPMTNQGLLGLIKLDPNYTVVSRMWNPHPRFRALAQSAMRRLVNSCEDLLILRRIIRATARSRLAGRGILLIPTELDIPILNDDNASLSADDFMSKLTDAMITPIRNEGDASGVVPLVIEGPGDTLDKIRWIDFASVFDEQAGKVREELVEVIAAGLDIPAEIITGITDANHWCVDESTRIMTRLGWRRHDEVAVGDEVLTLNHETGLSEWQPVRDFYRAQVTDEPMILMKGRDHSSLTTHNHRWPTVSSETGQRRFKTTETLARIDQIVTGSPSADQPDEAKWSDALIEIMGWYWTEGSQSGERVTIAQSHSANPDKVTRIRHALTRLYGPSKRSLRSGGVRGVAGWRESVQRGGLGDPVTVFHLNAQASRQLIDLAPRKCVTPEFVQSLTTAQLELFIDVSLQGDGHHYRTGRRDMFQSEPSRLDALEMAGVLAGYAVTRSDEDRHLNLSRKTTTRPVNSAHVAFRDSTGGAVTWMRPYTGTIWCPVTGNQTWLAQRDGAAYFTGNTAYQVSTDTFRQHIEPHAIALVKMLTASFLRPYFAGCPLDPAVIEEWVERIVIWYDPTELVTPTDLTNTGLNLHDRGVISNKALRRVGGFSDEDAPSADEFIAWLISKQRAWPANLSLGVIHGLDPELSIPPIETAGTIPGIKPGPGGGVDVGTPVAAVPVAAPPDESGMSAEGGVAFVAMLRQYFEAERHVAALALTAAVKPATQPSATSKRLSRQLGQGDQVLMTRLQAIANEAMLEQLRRAGGRLVQKLRADPAMRTKIAMTRKEHLMMVLGREAIERTGLTAASLMASDWDSLKDQYYRLTGQAQKAALLKAQQLAGGNDDSAAKADAALAVSLAAGWALLKSAMDTIAEHAAYNPDPNVDVEAAIAALNPDTIVPAGVVRAAVSVAGGANPGSFALTTLANGAAVPATAAGPVGGIGTGSIIGDYMSSLGAEPQGYTWEHGSTDRPLQGHLDLDGEEFASFDSDKLTNDQDWPPTGFYFPGDHDGAVVAGTIVEGSVPQALALRWYEGVIIEFTTASGQFLAVTHDHPILTDRGWIDAEFLIEGDHVLRSLDTKLAAGLVPDEYQIPTRVEELFASLWVTQGVIARAVPIAAKDFDGEGVLPEVAVVAADGDLRLHGQPKVREPLGEDGLRRARSIAAGLAGESSPFQGLFAVGTATLGTEGELRDLTTLVRAATAVDDELRLTSATWRHAETAEANANRSTRDAEVIGQSLDALAGFVELDKLIKVNRVTGFKGHVLDLQTREHWYVANGILVHNCTCQATPNWVSADDVAAAEASVGDDEG